MTITPEDLVRREVLVCVSSLVHTLSLGYGQGSDAREVEQLTEQAFELSSPVTDCEAALIEAGFTLGEDGDWRDPEGEDTCESDAASVLYATELDPEEREVYEHWAVTDWLGKKLEARGEKVDFDFAGLTIWGRTTTGQSISMDSVMSDICEALNSPERIAEALEG